MKFKILVAVVLILAFIGLFFFNFTRNRYIGIISGTFNGLFSLFNRGSSPSFPLNVTLDASSFQARTLNVQGSDLTFTGTCNSQFTYGTEQSSPQGKSCTITVKGFDGRIDLGNQISVSGRATRASLNERNYFPQNKPQISFSILVDSAVVQNVQQTFSFNSATGVIQKLKSDGTLDQDKFLNSEKLDVGGFSGDMYLNSNAVILFGTATSAKGNGFAFTGK